MSEDPAIPLPSGISQRRVADAIGVSVSTVSRALAGHPQVSARTRSEVVRAIDQLQRDEHRDTESGEIPTIVLSRSHTVADPPQESLEITFDQILAGAEAAAWDAGYRIYVVLNAMLLRQAANGSLRQDVHGVILAGGVVSPEVLDPVLAYNTPVVLIGGHLPERGIASVGSNNLHGMRSAVAHLIGLGHRRIGLVNGPTDTYTSTEKKAGYLTALAEAGIAVDLDLIRWHNGYSGFDVSSATALTGELLDLPERPTALVFATDGMALAGMAACHSRGLTVPWDISIVGYHDDPSAQLAVPQLTSVMIDRGQWGAAAVNRLLRALNESNAVGDRLLLPTRLMVRESTAPPHAERIVSR